MEIQANGATVYYELQGTGKQKVLLLHGWGCNTNLMKPLADGLSADATVLSIDFPGFGASSRPPEPWGVPDYAACVMELLNKLDFYPCSVVGHSFGGRVAIYLASTSNCPFTKLILTGAAGIRKPVTPESTKRAQEFQKIKQTTAMLKKTKLLAGVADAIEKKAREKYGSKDYNALDEEMRKTFVKVVNLDLSGRLANISVPTLLLWGTNDTETPLWMGQKMEQSIPDAGLVELQGGTHFAYLEQLPVFLKISKVFLKEENV